MLGEEYRPFPNIARRNRTQELLEVPIMVRSLRLAPEKRMIEIGCGRGVALAPLSRICRPARLVGIDVDSTLLVQAARVLNERSVSADLIQADVRMLPFRPRSFDIVIDFGTCYHVSSPEMALREIERILAPAGIFAEETRLNQLISHPIRSLRRVLPWPSAPRLRRRRNGLLWASREKVSAA